MKSLFVEIFEKATDNQTLEEIGTQLSQIDAETEDLAWDLHEHVRDRIEYELLAPILDYFSDTLLHFPIGLTHEKPNRPS